MKIFALKENYQDCDMDCWQHWVSNHILDYYSSRESAVKAMNKLIENNEVTHSFVWDAKLGDGRNISLFAVSPNAEHFEPHHRYFIDEIDVLS